MSLYIAEDVFSGFSHFLCCISLSLEIREYLVSSIDGSMPECFFFEQIALIPEWRGFPLNLPPVTDNLMMQLVRSWQRFATLLP